jgi:hypothetical protein
MRCKLIGGKGIQNHLVSMVLEKKTLKRYKFEKTSFHTSLIGSGLKKFQFGIVQCVTMTCGT